MTCLFFYFIFFSFFNFKYTVVEFFLIKYTIYSKRKECVWCMRTSVCAHTHTHHLKICSSNSNSVTAIGCPIIWHVELEQTHRSRAQTHKTASTTDASQEFKVSQSYPHFYPADSEFRDSHDCSPPPPGVIIL